MPKVKLRPFFCRIGSKRDIADYVMKYFPDEEDYDTYVEPFIGGGAIYWKKEPSKREVINDLDRDLIAGYRLLKRIRTRDFRRDLKTLPALQRFIEGPKRTDADKLTAQIVKRCNGFGGTPITIAKPKVYNESDPYAKLKKVDAYQERMANTTIENKSYEKVLSKYDGPRTFFYLDPPYEASGTLYGEHSGFDFEALRKALDRVKGKWLMSINDSPNIRRIFKGYYYKAFVVKSKGNAGVGSRDRRELLISNFGRGR
jgi:DNA adenine methylase